MNRILLASLALAGIAAAAPALAQITFYERDAFAGHSLTAQKQVPDLERSAFHNRAASVIVARDRWEVCVADRFDGACRVLRPGRYPSLAAMGLDGRISSARALTSDTPVADERYAATPWVNQDFRRHGNERVFDAPVTTVHAVVGPPEQRCWVEHGQVNADRNQGNILGGAAGAVIGGILGHQVGNGRGNDLATVGGALAGAAVGMNIARNREGQPAYTRDVQRCGEVANRAEPEYWDVTYSFRGREHQMQTALRPGATIRVNQNGEPRA